MCTIEHLCFVRLGQVELSDASIHPNGLLAFLKVVCFTNIIFEAKDVIVKSRHKAVTACYAMVKVQVV